MGMRTRQGSCALLPSVATGHTACHMRATFKPLLPAPARSPWVVSNCLNHNLETCEVESAAVVHTGVRGRVLCKGGGGRVGRRLGLDPAWNAATGFCALVLSPPQWSPPIPLQPLSESRGLPPPRGIPQPLCWRRL